MSAERLEVWERVYFDEKGIAIRWTRSLDKGESWTEIDCSAYPGGRPPFIKLLNNNNVGWIEQRNWEERTP